MMGRVASNRRLRSRSTSCDSGELGASSSRRQRSNSSRGRKKHTNSTRNIWKEIEDKLSSSKSIDVSLSPSKLKASSLRINPAQMSDELWTCSTDTTSCDDSQQSKDLESQRPATYSSFSGFIKSEIRQNSRNNENSDKIGGERGRDLSHGDRRGRANRLLSKSDHEITLRLKSVSRSPRSTSALVTDPSSSQLPPPPPLTTSTGRGRTSNRRRCRSNSNDDPRERVLAQQMQKSNSGTRRIVLEKKSRPTRDTSVGSVGAVRGGRRRGSPKRRGRRGTVPGSFHRSTSGDKLDSSGGSGTLPKRQQRVTGRNGLYRRTKSNVN